MVETMESRRRSRVVRIGSTAGVVVAAALVVWGFSRGNDDRSPPSNTSPSIGAINNPADVLTTQGAIVLPSGSAPVTEDVPAIPVGTADVAFPPVSSDIATP